MLLTFTWVYFGERQTVLNIETTKKAQLDDICRLVRDSIRRLYRADHKNDPSLLSNWPAERLSQKLALLMFAADSQGFVSMEEARIAGIAHITKAGQLTLCYVHPEQTAEGVGRLLLSEVERQAVDWDLPQLSRVSTQTVRKFYLAHGYVQYAEPCLYFGMPGYPMLKPL